MPESLPPSPSSISSCRILWSTQSGRAKACARRTARILGEKTSLELEGGIGCPFDETPVPFLELLTSTDSSGKGTLFLMFVSTTGDGEQCDTIRNTWKSLLQKSLPRDLLAESKDEFALFCLGDRAYGPQFCAGGRKLAVRLLQLGMTSSYEVGYGDDNTPNGGVFRDLDDWLEKKLLPKLLESSSSMSPTGVDSNDARSPSAPTPPCCPFRLQIIEERVKIGINNRNIENTKGRIIDEHVKKEEAEEVEWKKEFFEDSYRDYFTARGPITAYSYDTSRGERITTTATPYTKPNVKSIALIGSVAINDRITALDWKQDTRHLEIRLMKSESQPQWTNDGSTDRNNPDACTDLLKRNAFPLPYVAGDVASILPFNSREEVNRFLKVLPDSISSLSDSPIQIDLDESYAMDNRFTRWPRRCTLRGWLTYCADIQSILEREDLRALSAYCAPWDKDLNQDGSLDQGEKLRSLSETSEAALYADYIIREKRSWIDVFYDFESLREPGSRLTLEALLMLLPPMRTRDFSIASAPSMGRICSSLKDNISSYHTKNSERDNANELFSIELCVAVVEGKTRLGRSYHGLCSKFLSQITPSHLAAANDEPFFTNYSTEIQIWIRPGTFGKMPRQLATNSSSSFKVPIICVGAGTGIAPMRSLLLERIALRSLAVEREKRDHFKSDCKTNLEDNVSSMDRNENILVFGCRKQMADYYYKEEWQTLSKENNIRILTAFSQDQVQKMYVQKIIREADDGMLIAKHVLERGGAFFIAGGPKMARAVRQEIIEALSDSLPGGEKQANQLLNKMQRIGRFSIEAWS
uniref:Uncharacterized protein n=1 Tax=Pseudo-nitzschia australis TaxID=44445 RepID=A0A7S4ABR6_9STRA